VSAEPQPTPTSLVEDPTLFGQGAAMQVAKFEIRSRVARSREETSDSGQRVRSRSE
jgi:hypothetical protein